MYTFYWYPKCSTCRQAKAWLDEQQIAYETVDLVQETPTAEQISGWLTNSELPLRRLFNTSGMKYRELGLKDQIGDFSIKEAGECLATDGMLIKRPLLIKDGVVAAVGFKEAEYHEAVNK